MQCTRWWLDPVKNASLRSVRALLSGISQFAQQTALPAQNKHNQPLSDHQHTDDSRLTTNNRLHCSHHNKDPIFAKLLIAEPKTFLKAILNQMKSSCCKSASYLQTEHVIHRTLAEKNKTHRRQTQLAFDLCELKTPTGARTRADDVISKDGVDERDADWA